MTAGHILTPKKVRSIVTIPTIAFPTVLLFIICFVGSIVMVWGLHIGEISRTMCVVVNTILIFAIFTPLHDACHGSVAKNQLKWINDVIGFLSAFILCAPYTAFRYIHLQHHQHTNDVEKDPDAYTSFGPWFILPLRWATIEFRHYYCYFSAFFARPLSELSLAIGQLCFNYGLVWYCFHIGHGSTAFFGWVLPSRTAIFLLALFFDYLPHRPHSHTRWENEYLATSLIALWPSKSSVSLLTWPLLHQNYHNIHHLAPYIPFYMYEEVWSHCKNELEKHGTQTIPIFGSAKKIE